MKSEISVSELLKIVCILIIACCKNDEKPDEMLVNELSALLALEFLGFEDMSIRGEIRE